MNNGVAAGLIALVGLTAPLWPAVAQRGALVNESFEQFDDGGLPAQWQPVDFGTPAEALQGEDGGRTGASYVIARVTGNYQRAGWRRHLTWDPQARGVTVTGWYRAPELVEARGRGAAIRLVGNAEPEAENPLAVQMALYPHAAPGWTRVEVTRVVPAGTRELVVELLNWGALGEVYWDDIAIRPATDEELLANLLPPDRAVDRAPILGRNLPYSPADGESVQLNPPPFRWLPSGAFVDPPVPEQVGGVRMQRHGIGMEVSYRLQVARDPDFSAPLLVDLGGLKYCAEMLTAPLAPGTWYWRYGVQLQDPPLPDLPVVWSRARCFEVTLEANKWPYPDESRFRVPEGRPRLFVRADEEEALRHRATEGDLREDAQALLQHAASAFGEELPDEPDFLPEEMGEIIPAMGPIIWGNRPPMNAMQALGFTYALTGNEQVGAEAKRRVLHYFSWDPQGSTGYFRFDEPAMWMMMTGVRAYDWTRELFTQEERALVERSIRVRAADMYRVLRLRPYENDPYESHSGRTLGFLGEVAIVFYHEWEEAPEYLDYVTRIFWGIYPAWGRDDGGWNEGPNYWDAYMAFGLHFVLALRQATGIDLAQRPFFANTPYYRLYLTPPHSRMAPFGDGAQAEPSLPDQVIYWFSTLNRDPVLRWYAEAVGAGPGSGQLGILLRDDTIEARPPTDLPPARLFEGAGLAVLRTDLMNGDNDVGFIMRSSPFGAVSHGHNDQNCFALEAYGEALAICSGYYNGYGRPHHSRWTQQTRAKNGITFDGGEGQDRGPYARGRIAAFSHDDSFDLVIGDATEAYGGRLSRALREVVHVRPGVFVIRDDLAGNRPRRFEYQLHALEEMALRPDTGEVVIARPKASLTVRFLEPGDLELSQTDQFDPPPTWPTDREYPNQWHTTAAHVTAATEAEFLTVLLPVRAGEEDALPRTRHLLSETARGVELTFADGRRVIVGFALPGAEAPISLEGFGTDGRIFAIRLAVDGTPGEVLLHGGESLMANGRKL